MSSCNVCLNVMSQRHNCIFCDLCCSWIHMKCANLSLSHFNCLANSDLPFFCQNCILLELPFVLLHKRQFNNLFYNSNKITTFNYKFPCTVCQKPVRKNQNSILCDVCQKWSHHKCTSLSTGEFISLASSSFPFYCYKCYKDLFPFHNLVKDDLNFVFKNQSSDNTSTFNTTNCAITNTSKHVQYITAPEINTHFNNSLIIIHVNARSLNKNFDKLHELITDMKIKPDVIGLTAT